MTRFAFGWGALLLSLAMAGGAAQAARLARCNQACAWPCRRTALGPNGQHGAPHGRVLPRTAPALKTVEYGSARVLASGPPAKKAGRVL